jgi:hypothetical protein
MARTPRVGILTDFHPMAKPTPEFKRVTLRVETLKRAALTVGDKVASREEDLT